MISPETEPLRHQNVTRYITPLREGGSLPALAEADDGFKYVVKFRGAGHGTKALIAELIGGEIAPGSPDELRRVYRDFLVTRLHNSEIFLKQAIDGRNAII